MFKVSKKKRKIKKEKRNFLRGLVKQGSEIGYPFDEINHLQKSIPKEIKIFFQKLLN